MQPHDHGRIARTPRWPARLPRGTVVWGAIVGAGQAASPVAFWWLDPSTVYSFTLVVIASVYIGFAVADGRTKVAVVESGVAAAFVLLAATAISGSSWILVTGLVAHAVKDAWQHRTQFVRNTRWWPPFCAAVDLVAATILALLIASGVDFHG